MGFGKYSSSSKISALVVDDDTIIQKIHKALLTKLGLEVNVVANGKEVLDLYRSGTSFDLIFMDMEMPIMDGPEATKELRAMGVQSIIMGVTSRDLDSEKEAFIASGLNDCYMKPLTISKISSLLQELMKKN
ncbi:two-component response regulator 24-like [Vitis riparia]|uniref:two-component response regulator 24-like n=1 Tax=Vitis riparia TaxID=96939 RepID=UPI00155A837A|nr:two-component response regulator 24-like [Vitis riparia]